MGRRKTEVEVGVRMLVRGLMDMSHCQEDEGDPTRHCREAGSGYVSCRILGRTVDDGKAGDGLLGTSGAMPGCMKFVLTFPSNTPSLTIDTNGVQSAFLFVCRHRRRASVARFFLAVSSSGCPRRTIRTPPPTTSVDSPSSLAFGRSLQRPVRCGQSIVGW